MTRLAHATLAVALLAAALLPACGGSAPPAEPVPPPTPVAAIDTPPPEFPLALACAGMAPTGLLFAAGLGVAGAMDAITDVAHMFLADKKVAIYGNPDLVIGLAQFCIDLEMKPQLLLLGDDNARYADDPRLKEMVEKVNWKMEVVTNADLWDLDGRLKRKEIELDLILGHSKGRWAAMDNNIPMLRVGFPTYDRAGLYRYPVMGYAGAMWLAENMANTLFTDMEYKKNKEWILNVW